MHAIHCQLNSNSSSHNRPISKRIAPQASKGSIDTLSDCVDTGNKGARCVHAMLLAIAYCMGQAIPHKKKNFLSNGPETRRKRSVCSRVSKRDIERVQYLIFDKVMGI
jgi:hypothetical protein